MADTDTKIYIKQIVVAQDVSFGIGTEAQVRNGINVNGDKINSNHIVFNSPDSPYHGKTVTEVLDILLASTGA